MPSIDVVEPRRIRALYLRWLDQQAQTTRMDIAATLAEIPLEASYRQRQVASSRLSGAMAGKERVSRTRWSHWLWLAEQAGIACSDLRDGEVQEDPRLDTWPLPSRRNTKALWVAKESAPAEVA